MGAYVVDTWLRAPAKAAPMATHFDKTVQHGLRNFSGFIYRMTSPPTPDLFMGPGNRLRMVEMLLSMSAGDLFRGTPIHWSLRRLKGAYHLVSLRNPPRTLRAWRRRKQVTPNPQGETVASA